MKAFLGKLLKKRWVQVVIGIVIILLIANYWLSPKDEEEYVLAEAFMGDLVQSVDVTGTIKADPTINLHFQTEGTVKEILVSENDIVEKDDLLATLENEKLELDIAAKQANLDFARAQYNQTAAGAKYEEILISQAELTSAEASLDAAIVELENTREIGDKNIRIAELNYEQAIENEAKAEREYENTKELAEKEIAKLKIDGDGEDSSQKVALDNAYNNANATIDTLFPVMQDGLYKVEEIIGIRGIPFKLLRTSKRSEIERTYYDPSKEIYDDAQETYNELPSSPTNEELDNLISITLNAANAVSSLIANVRYELQQLDYDDAQLANYISVLTTQSSTLSTNIISLQNYENTINSLTTSSGENVSTLELSYQLQIDQAENAYLASQKALEEAEQSLEQAKLNAEITNKNAEANVSLKGASVDSAQAALQLKKSPARDVDLAPIAAQIRQAEAALQVSQNQYEDSQLITPIDGKVTYVNGEVGEILTLTERSLEPFITIQADNLIVEANVPETDIVKLEVGDPVEMTIDAFDFTEKFKGEVVTIDPAETIIQGVIYYKIKTAFNVEDERIKSGMTVNLMIQTDKKEDVLLIPLRALKFEDSTKYVDVLNNGKPIKTTITTGIESDQYVEVLSGITEGDKVITFTK